MPERLSHDALPLTPDPSPARGEGRSLTPDPSPARGEERTRAATARPASNACLVDTTRCIGCRSCQVACKQAHGLKTDRTRFFAKGIGYQNPLRFSPANYNYVSFHELDDGPEGPRWVFAKHQCMHCRVLYCAAGCPTQVYRRNESGEVVYEADNCVGCGACIDLCPFRVPAIDYWDGPVPHVRKCDFCYSRRKERGGKPACAQACPTGAMEFGDRQALIAEARRRIAAEPKKYLNHVYGEEEAGGTAWLYLSAVPFEKLGFPVSFERVDQIRKNLLG